MILNDIEFKKFEDKIKKGLLKPVHLIATPKIEEARELVKKHYAGLEKIDGKTNNEGGNYEMHCL